MFVLSLFLAGTIAGPMRRLAEAAERVRRGINSREEIPDFTDRSDEIGHLSGALRDMTQALYTRMEAIESFAADVAHELKNPLTSLRSAVETLPRIKAEESRDRLMAVIQHDIRRLDRLISDISDASRLDAELARGRRAAGRSRGAAARPSSAVANERRRATTASASTLDDRAAPRRTASAHRAYRRRRARFAARAGDQQPDRQCALVLAAGRHRAGRAAARLAARRRRGREDGVEIMVDDDGPGIPAHAFERIFERFYTDRPSQGFGQNSGLGLSISRQIIEAHGGRIWAANRLDAGDDRRSRPTAMQRRRSSGCSARASPSGCRLSGAVSRPDVRIPCTRPPLVVGEAGILIRGASGSRQDQSRAGADRAMRSARGLLRAAGRRRPRRARRRGTAGSSARAASGIGRPDRAPRPRHLWPSPHEPACVHRVSSVDLVADEPPDRPAARPTAALTTSVAACVCPRCCSLRRQRRRTRATAAPVLRRPDALFRIGA